LPKSAGLAGWDLALVSGVFLAGMGGSLGWGCLRPAREGGRGDLAGRPEDWATVRACLSSSRVPGW
jgi:hypothetical protein